MESFSSSAGLPQPQDARTTMLLVRDWQTSLGLRFADPEPQGPLADPRLDEAKARRQFTGRLGTIFALGVTHAYPDLQKIAGADIPDDAWEAPGIPKPVWAIGEAVASGIQRVFEDRDVWKWKGAGNEGFHPAYQAIDDAVKLRTLPCVPSSLVGEIKRPATFGTRKIWNVHQVIPDVVGAAGISGNPDVHAGIAARSRGISVALAHIHYPLISPLFDPLEGKDQRWKSEMFRLHPLAGDGYSLEMRASAVTSANKELRRRNIGPAAFRGAEVLGCPVMHVCRDGSSRKIIAELHDLVGMLANKYYRFLAKTV